MIVENKSILECNNNFIFMRNSWKCTQISQKVTEVGHTRKCTTFGSGKQDGKVKHYLFSHF